MRMTSRETQDRDDLIALIARETLGFETLETRNADALDFREVAAWNVKAALEAAFAAGRASLCAERPKRRA
jgi:uncharacterized membrane protein